MTNKRNASGAPDPTAYEAVQNIQYQKVTACAEYMIKLLKKYLRTHGFELIGRMPIGHVKSGREFR